MKIVVAALLLASAALAPQARAATSIRLPNTIVADTYGGGRVLWAEHQGNTPVVIRATPGGVLATLPPFSGDVTISLAANATGYIVGLRDQGRDVVLRGGFDGTLRTVLDCSGKGGDAALAVAAGTAGFAFEGARCGVAAPVDLVAADATITPVPGLALNPLADLSYREPFVAGGALRVLDLADGTHRDIPGEVKHSALVADGTLVIGAGSVDSGISVWRPGTASPDVVSTDAFPEGGLIASETGVVFEAVPRAIHGQLALARVPLAGGGLQPAGAPGVGYPRFPLAMEGNLAAIANYACDGPAQITVVDVTQPPAPGVQYGCPVRLGRGAIGAKAGVICPNGCKAQLRFTRASSGRHRCDHGIPTGDDGPALPRCPLVATAKLALRPSRRVQRAPLRFTHTRATRVDASLSTSGGSELVGTTHFALKTHNR